ncbi:ABC transporter ATP-binding protein [Celeribacter indicus]|uniref:Spermidine/putrescine ABC transporter ATPase n=1 Tax=Celeribacter indicus TaxID=1208324 RepID=A0A0B5E150_9RHOB|nr:ABC transporter ATP-binding protein [Celeribacter indicus]AJE46152.1 spermidine/putrescine ABC transporter ATPase [Celeribacter indicus]SDX36755.1 iron(III) transport system ATP-binding protein [Celeribacter indicus]
MSQVDISGLSKSFGNASALNALDLGIADGEFVVLLGPSGCGKTTALRCIAGLEYPDAGTIHIGGREVVAPQSSLFVPPHRRGIGMVFQSYALWPHMTIEANVGYPLRARGADRATIRRKTSELLELVGLDGFARRHPAELSGGQQQRVALARALVADPALVLFDEPLSNLDAQLRIRLRDEIRRIHSTRRRTSIYVTHDHAEALTLADRIVLLNRGRIEQQGTPDEIFLAPRSRFVAEFVGIHNFLPGRITGHTAHGVTFRPDTWQSDLNVASTSRPAIGARATAGFRTSSATAVATPDDDRGFSARLIATSYTGERFDAQVDAGGHTLTVSLPLSGHGGVRAGEGYVHIRIQPSEILLLPDPETSPETTPAEHPREGVRVAPPGTQAAE